MSNAVRKCFLRSHLVKQTSYKAVMYAVVAVAAVVAAAAVVVAVVAAIAVVTAVAVVVNCSLQGQA